MNRKKEKFKEFIQIVQDARERFDLMRVEEIATSDPQLQKFILDCLEIPGSVNEENSRFLLREATRKHVKKIFSEHRGRCEVGWENVEIALTTALDDKNVIDKILTCETLGGILSVIFPPPATKRMKRSGCEGKDEMGTGAEISKEFQISSFWRSSRG